MIGRAIDFEVDRLRSTASTWWALMASMVATGILTAGFAVLISDLVQTTSEAVTGTEMLVVVLTRSPVVPVVAGVLGILAVAPDWRSGAIDTALLVTPRRSVVFVAKLLSTWAASVALAAANLAVAWAVVIVLLPGAFEREVSVASVVAANVGLVAQALGWAAIGLAIGSIARSPAGSFGVLLLAAFVGEPAVGLFLSSAPGEVSNDLAAFLPFAAGQAMTATTGEVTNVLLDAGAGAGRPLLSAAVFAGYVAGILGCASAVFARADT